MNKVNPKCLAFKELAYTAEGYLAPCCWCDNPVGWREPQIARLKKEHLKLKNNKKVEDIIYSKEWKDFFKELDTNPAKTCQRFCGVPLNFSVNKRPESGSQFRRWISHKQRTKIKIGCVYFEGKYSPDYVEKLYNGLKKHCTLPFEFICYSDNPNVKADRVIPLPKDSKIKRHWHKLTFFNPEFADQKEGDEIIIMDIDQIIVNNIDDIIGWPVVDNELVSYDKWWGVPKPKVQGGFFKFKSGQCKVIWDTYIKDPEKWQLHYYNTNQVHYKYFGEQNFVEDIATKNDKEITLINGKWIGKYTLDKQQNLENNVAYCKKFDEDYMILDKPNPNLKIIHFAGPETAIHNCKADWIKSYWNLPKDQEIS